MIALYSVRLTKAAVADLERLQDFLFDKGDPAAVSLLDFMMDAIDVLTHQPGVGRPMKAGLRELIIERGSSGYLAQYALDKTAGVVLVARIRHQRESGYPRAEI